MDAIKTWFEGFEKGLSRLSPTERENFFCECGKNCVTLCETIWRGNNECKLHIKVIDTPEPQGK